MGAAVNDGPTFQMLDPRSYHLKNSTALRNNRSPSPSEANPSRVHCGCCVGNTCRSGCGIRPNTRPDASQTPATSPCEPFGFTGKGRGEGRGARSEEGPSQYRSTTCPACSRPFKIHSC